MSGIMTYLSILTLNVNRLNSKDTDWQTGLKKNSQQSVATGDPSYRQKQALA
jgi:hypothetical protein